MIPKKVTNDHGSPMSVLLQISDLHFGTERAPVVEALVTLACQQRPYLLVLLGTRTAKCLRNKLTACPSAWQARSVGSCAWLWSISRSLYFAPRTCTTACEGTPLR